MSMRGLLLPAFAALALSFSTAHAQNDDGRGGALGTEEDIDPDGAPVIIEQLPPDTEESGEPIRSGRGTVVQIQGAWASDPAACAGVENGDSGLYVTDTLVRWEGATCSIREIDTREESARLYAECAGVNGRSERVFELEARGEDQLAWHDGTGQEQEVLLRRCPE